MTFDEVCIELWNEYDDDSLGVLSAVDRLIKAHDLDIQEQDKHIAELEAEMDFLRGTMRARVSAIKFELKEQGITDYEGFAPSEVNYLQCIRAGFVKANKRVKELEAMNEDLRGRIDKLNWAEVEK
jgi:hypothetical protein